MGPTNSLEQKFAQLKGKIAELTTQKIRLEGDMQRLNQEKVDILQQATTLGIDPKQLDQVIQELEVDIQQQLTHLEAQLNECTNRSTN